MDGEKVLQAFIAGGTLMVCDTKITSSFSSSISALTPMCGQNAAEYCHRMLARSPLLLLWTRGRKVVNLYEKDINKNILHIIHVATYLHIQIRGNDSHLTLKGSRNYIKGVSIDHF